MTVAQSQFVVDGAAAIAGFAGRIKPADDRKRLSAPVGLIGQPRTYCPHCGVIDALGQLGSRKTSNIQSLDTDCPGITYNACCQFMNKILSPMPLLKGDEFAKTDVVAAWRP
jgi:hypothetical protein